MDLEKPDTALHDKQYAEHWKDWIVKYLESQTYTSKEEAMKLVMKETRGLINPSWVLEVLND